MKLLSVIIPVYNESATIRQIVEKINSLNIDKEIIAVDDGSSDGSDKILKNIRHNDLKVIFHTSNRGKGCAVLTGLSHASGEFVIIQDADLEYDPNDYYRLLEKSKETSADIVLGARFIKGYKGLFIHTLGNRVLTGMLNLLFHARLNDSFTCYKLFRNQTAQILKLKARGFDIDIEILAKALKQKLSIVETFVSYRPRGYSQGKKIRCKDGLLAAVSMLKYWFMAA